MGRREIDLGRLAVLAATGALVAGAIVIVKLAGAGSHDVMTAARVFAITFALVIFAPNAAAGLHLAARRPKLAPLGGLIAAVTMLGFVAVAIRIVEVDYYFGDDGSGGGGFNLQGVAVVVALAAGQIALVLVYDRDDDPLPLRLLSAATAFDIVVFGAAAAYEVADSGGDISARFFGIVATLYLLGVALLILFHGAEWIRRRNATSAS